MENYLYFRNQATLSSDDDIAQSAMFAVSNFRGCYPVSASTLKLHFRSVFLDSAATSRVIQNDTNLEVASIMVQHDHDIRTDTVILNVTANKHKEVMQALANTMTQSQAGFINVADDVSGAPSYLHANITSCGSITINTAAQGEDTYSSTFA
tara:strand:+ start:396 stop:851 length:456 start_codon:yes stop_codon:yes gene_type:complete